MKKNIFLFMIIVAFTACTYNASQRQLNKKDREKLRIDTHVLKSLNDSFNQTGDYKYMKKYMLKVNQMIIEFPDEKGLVDVRDNFIKIYGDSLK